MSLKIFEYVLSNLKPFLLQMISWTASNKVLSFQNGLLVETEYWGMIRQDRSIIMYNEIVNNDK